LETIMGITEWLAMEQPKPEADAEAMRLIHAELVKTQFSSDTLNAIREIVRSTGRNPNWFEQVGG
jgi:hypothetical protein